LSREFQFGNCDRFMTALKYFILFCFLFRFGFVKSQAGLSKAELLHSLVRSQPDSILIDTYNELSWPVYSFDHPDSAIYYSKKAIVLAEKIHDLKRLSIAHRRIGIAYINKGEFQNSVRHQEESFTLSEQIGYKEGMSKALNNMGVIYLNNELLNKALYYFLKSLKIAENNQDSITMASLYNNCGLIYMRTEDFTKAIEFLSKALRSAGPHASPDMLIDFYCNLSSSHRNLNHPDSALHYLVLAESQLGNSHNNKSEYTYYTSRGLLYAYKGQHQKAFECFLKANETVGNTNDKITVLINLAEESIQLGDKPGAKSYFTEAYKIAEATKSYSNLTYLSQTLIRYSISNGDAASVQRYAMAHLAYRDSNDKYVKVQQIRQQQLEFDYEKKLLADSLKFAQRENLKNLELAVASSQLNKEKSFRLMLILMLALAILLAVFLYNRFFVMRKQHNVIENQKQIVELKNREILDSINYAKRLQSAILPPLHAIRNHFSCDIMFIPKDIIGGDFYFFEVYKNKLFFAVCDCTGHGIPGALMSVVCHQAMKKSILEFELSNPAQILEKTRELIIDQLHASEHNIKDGMDCSLLVIDKLSNTYFWAGANNPLWIWQDGEFNEHKADKQPVALYENAGHFNCVKGNLTKNTRFCLFTDGYADQFGGEKGKKFKVKQLKEILQKEINTDTGSLIAILERNFKSWKSHIDQVDDVTIALVSV
jgi:serine phosphatase RsbU (regulator of sigma subunit)